MLTITTNRLHYTIINRAVLAETTKRQYKQAIDRLIEARVDPRDRSALAAYAESLPNSSRSFLKHALKLLFSEQVTELKALARPGNIAEIQAALFNIEAIGEAIQTSTTKGQRSHTWLTAEQVTQLSTIPTDTPRAMRDYLTIGLLLHGLRRDEAARATFADVKTIPDSQGRPRPVLDVIGKGNKARSVPLNDNLFRHLQEWQRKHQDGYILRSLNSDSISGQAIKDIVTSHGTRIGLPALQPHDLRRTYGHLIYNGTKDIMRTMTLLGHSDPKTTRRYLNLSLDVDDDVTQFIPLG